MKKSCVFVVCAVAALSCAFTNSYADVREHERAVLIALYNSTNGDSWDPKLDWKHPPLSADGFSDNDHCYWNGVYCDKRNVLKIDLSENNLDGSIPPRNWAILRIFSNFGSPTTT